MVDVLEVLFILAAEGFVQGANYCRPYINLLALKILFVKSIKNIF
jgi:hypothetical protein